MGPIRAPVLAQMAARLEKAGAEVLAMPCNTAHLYAFQIEENVGIALLNMPKLACAQAAQGVQRGDIVGVLASPATNNSGLFEGCLAEYGVTLAYPESVVGILAAIRRIKKSGPTQDDIILLENEAAALVKRRAKKMIVGCSEFSLVSERIRASVPITDSLDVLVSEILKFSGVRVKPPT